MRYPMPSTASGTALLIAARTCSSFGRTASGCAAMYSSTDLGTLCFIPLILCFGIRFFLTDIRLALQFLRRSLPDCQRNPLHRFVVHGTMSGDQLDEKSPSRTNDAANGLAD